MKNNNQINVPQAHEAMDKFKMLIKLRGRCQPAGRLQHLTDLPHGQKRVSRTSPKI